MNTFCLTDLKKNHQQLSTHGNIKQKKYHRFVQYLEVQKIISDHHQIFSIGSKCSEVNFNV